MARSLHLSWLSSDPIVFLSLGPSDDEKGRQMWRKYLEREDSRIGGKCRQGGWRWLPAFPVNCLA